MALKENINNRFPDYAELIDPEPLKIEDVQTGLLSDEAIVSIYIGRDRSYIWAIPNKRPIVFTSFSLDRKDVKDMVDRVRHSLEPNAETLGEIPEFDLDTAYTIYQAFLEPVKEGWQDAKTLLIIPHGVLGYLPFSLLPTKPTKLAADKEILFQNYQEVPWLARNHAVMVMPSASSLKTLRALPPSDPHRLPFVGFGDPYFSEQQAKAATMPKEEVQTAALENRGDYGIRGISIQRLKTDQLNSAELEILPRLPETADEIRSIAMSLNADLTRDVYTGIRANEQQVKTMDLSDYKVIAFATHGLAPGDLNGLLQPALALSSPQVAGIEGDGLLTMGEILGLRLNADWVVLSACNTGAGKERGTEALSGLGRAFFYAGARSLLVSNWPVETTSAKLLTTDLFRRQAENSRLSRAEALRQTMLSLIDRPGYIDLVSGKVVFSSSLLGALCFGWRRKQRDTIKPKSSINVVSSFQTLEYHPPIFCSAFCGRLGNLLRF
jgi:CHAT domain-containing protein